MNRPPRAARPRAQLPEGQDGQTKDQRHPYLPTTPEELRSYVPYLLNRLANDWNLEQSRSLAEYDINATALRTLSVLSIYKTLTVNEIASYAVVEQSNASRTIDTMVAAGLVERQIAETDLRRREVALTDKGRDLLARLWPTMGRNHDRLVGGIPAKKLEECAATLLAMIANLGRSES